MKDAEIIDVRPFQLINVVCALGGDAAAGRDPQTRSLMRAVRRNPDTPLTLRCNVGEVFAFQDPGSGDDTAESAEINLRRDLEILHKLDFAPGTTLPARMVFLRIWDQIPDASGICSFGRATSGAWQGWPRARLAAYRKGHKRGPQELIIPRTRPAMAADKKRSMAAVSRAAVIDSRPHVLMCAVCQYGAGARPPFAEDNVPELLQIAIANPKAMIRMVPHADWMMCAPCPYRAAAANACVNNRGNGGLPNQMRDLRVLQKLGLVYGSVMPARELFKRILARIPGTLEICRIEQPRPSVWWTGCGALESDNKLYLKGRAALLKVFGMKTAAGRIRT